jgi:TonB-linked SusC/RagA family outer membrane protein
MSAQAVALDQVVVTGTAGNQERRAQAAVVTSIDAAEITATAPVRDVNELLTARTPGVSLTRASGTSGANTRLDIRGQASVSLSNYPLVFIDGVRVLAGPRAIVALPTSGGGTTAGTGGQQLNALSDLNPEDIESIEIVKGPAASTLYGADASAGVIQILTKKGRAGQRRFSQSLTTEYNTIDPNFTPLTNFARCTAALVATDSPHPLCRGQAVNSVISDNPIERMGAFDDGWAGSLLYSGQGGAESYGYFVSLGAQEEEGTNEGSILKHRNGRVNFNWLATPTLRLDVNVALLRADERLPQGDQSAYGYLINGGFGSALTVREGQNGELTGGLLNNNLSIEAISAIQTRSLTYRTIPSVQVQYTPFSWFNNRLTVGGDLVRRHGSQFFPKNDRNWYSALANTGAVAVTEADVNQYTVDYLGNINTRFGRDGWLSSDLSFGSQWINTVNSAVGASGQGLLVNANNVISATTTSSASEDFVETRSWGLLAQEQIGFNDRLFLQLGARVDRHSAFGDDAGTIFLPKGGVSWVLSEEPFWRGIASAIPTFRLRAAYGTTGRSPSGIQALRTFQRANFITDQGVVQPGVAPGNPGNENLEPERGTEFEAGFDASVLRDRVGIELTYFDKRSKDLLFPLPLPPSSGFASNPLVNIGEVTNKGLELSIRATPVDLPNVRWDATFNMNTLDNEIVSMGNITPFVSANNQCFKPGIEVAGWCVPRVLSVDTDAGRAVVSDTAEFVGGQLPKRAGSVNTTLTLFRNLRVYAQLDGKFDYHVYNLTKDFRDRSLRNSREVTLTAEEGGYSDHERVRRLGPFATQSGTAVGTSLVRDPYIVPGDFVRFRELSVTWSLPSSIASRFAMSGASISVGGRNLGLWTDYDGLDPEVIGTIDNTTPYLADVFTTPQARRLFARLSVQF